MLQNKICGVGHSFHSNTLFPRKIIGYAFTGVENRKNRTENNSWLLQINKLLHALAIWVYDWSSTTTTLDRRLRTTLGSHNYKNIHTRSYSTYSELFLVLLFVNSSPDHGINVRIKLLFTTHSVDKWIAHISFEIAQYPPYSSGDPGIANDPHFLWINISIEDDMKSPSTYSTNCHHELHITDKTTRRRGLLGQST